MDAQRIVVALHILLGIIMTGQALFWFVMDVALRREHGPDATLQLLRTAQAARWPHVAVPWKLRLPLPLMGWATLALLLATGLALLQLRGAPSGGAWHFKLAAVAGLVLFHAMLHRRPSPALAKINLLFALAAMAGAALSIR